MSTKNTVEVNGMYVGRMTNQQIEVVEEIRRSRVVPVLKHTIMMFPPELVIRSIEECRSIRSIASAEGIDISKYIGELRDYQTIGTAFMYFSPRSMIADGVGLGKTVEIASLINMLYNKREMTRFLMAVECGALTQTQCELIKMTGLNIITLPSEKAKLEKVIWNTDWEKVDGIVIKHTLLRSDAFSKFLAMNIDNTGKCRIFSTFILDESSCIKNDTTKMYQYTYNICQLADRVHFMNATAFETKIMDIYYQIDMMNCDLLPAKGKITGKYCTWDRKSYWAKERGKATKKFSYSISGYKNTDKFKESLKMVYFGRTKKDVGIDTPHVYKVYTVEPTIKQFSAIAKFGRYNEILNCPSLVEECKLPTNADEVPKIARLIEIIENEFNDSKVMIYVFHRKAQEVIKNELEKIGRKPLILNGETEQVDKFKIQSEFNEGDCDVLITNIKKSLNLQGGDACIFYSLITNPASLFQAAGRIDRNVDDRIKTFILLLYEGTQEYDYFKDVVAKRSQYSKELTIDAKTAVDYFIECLEE
jgi:SWF/SNF family helicase